MASLYFITHPEVVIDPTLPITLWDYSERGAARLEKILKKIWIKSVESIYSSDEPRATKAAQLIADQLGYRLYVLHELGDINRKSTGVVSREEFEILSKEFYDRPDRSVRGWEKATDAQQRILKSIEIILETTPTSQHIAFVSHTDLANLLLCTIKGIPIQKIQKLPMTFSFEAEPGEKPKNWKSLDLL